MNKIQADANVVDGCDYIENRMNKSDFDRVDCLVEKSEMHQRVKSLEHKHTNYCADNVE